MRWRYLSFLTFKTTLKSQKYIMEIKECSKQIFLKILPKNIFLDKKKSMIKLKTKNIKKNIIKKIWKYEHFWNFKLRRSRN